MKIFCDFAYIVCLRSPARKLYASTGNRAGHEIL